MARKLKLTPLQGDLLLMLEEAGAEDFSTILATFKLIESESFDAAIHFLYSRNLVSFHETDDAGNEKYWFSSEANTEPPPALSSVKHSPELGNVEVEITSTGLAAVTS